MKENNANDDHKKTMVTLPCGCQYDEKSWLLTRIKECKYHKQKRKRKRPYRAKAECVRP